MAIAVQRERDDHRQQRRLRRDEAPERLGVPEHHGTRPIVSLMGVQSGA
ncbi:MAG TPA: hypothetical protein VFD90_08620 [Gaiellales bacterium]|nr:hypothetical protein [Gaiellales bacterium]